MAAKLPADDPVIEAIVTVFQRHAISASGSHAVYLRDIYGSDDPIGTLAGELATEVYAEIGKRAVARGSVLVGPFADRP